MARYAICLTAQVLVLFCCLPFCHSQQLSWDFGDVSNLPTGWTNLWDVDGNCVGDPGGLSCDLLNVPWSVQLEQLNPPTPTYLPMDASVLGPLFSVVANSWILSFTLPFDLNALGGPGQVADQLDIDLLTFVQGIPAPLNAYHLSLFLGDSFALTDLDQDDGVEDGVVTISEPIDVSQAGTTYRLRVRAMDFDENATFSGVVLDDFHFAAAVLASDADSNGAVSGMDFLSWQQGFGLAFSATHADGDADANGTVEGADLAIWQDQFGSTAGIPAVSSTGVLVPEPATSAIALTAALLALLGMREPLASYNPTPPRQ